jgi:hypothetical protein
LRIATIRPTESRGSGLCELHFRVDDPEAPFYDAPIGNLDSSRVSSSFGRTADNLFAKSDCNTGTQVGLRAGRVPFLIEQPYDERPGLAARAQARLTSSAEEVKNGQPQPRDQGCID